MIYPGIVILFAVSKLIIMNDYCTSNNHSSNN